MILLHVQRDIVRFALAAAHVFAWIFVYEYWFVLGHGNWTVALIHTVYAYALTHIVALLFTPVSTHMLGNSFKRSLLYGTLALTLAFASLATVFQGLWGVYHGLGVALFAIGIGVYRAAYWVSYHSETSGGVLRVHRLRETIYALLPAIVGILLGLGRIDPAQLLGGAACIVLLSAILLLWYEDHYERFTWNYMDTFLEFFSRKRYRLIERAIFDGVEHATFLLLWPLLILMVVGSHALLGCVLSLSMICVLLVRMPKASEYVTHTLYADGGRYIDEFTALAEMAESVGRIALCMCVAIVAILSSFSFALFSGVFFALLVAIVRTIRSRSL